MAQPCEIDRDAPQLAITSLEPTGWLVPPGEYGIVRAAGTGIVRRALVDHEEGMAALQRLGDPEPDSRNPAHDGRRLVRIGGGFVVLNFFAYRDRDYTAAERSARYRENKARRLKQQARAIGAKQTREVVARLKEKVDAAGSNQ
jgi:hypothetical protein